MRRSFVFTLVVGLIGMAAGLFEHMANPSSKVNEVLSEMEMGKINGGCFTKECRTGNLRKDECYHAFFADPCQTTQCIANYITEDTCDPCDSTCNAVENPDKFGSVQYLRQDSNCTTDHPGGPVTWYTHYYGSACTQVVGKTRCDKVGGSCDGTLIDSGSNNPGIVCE